MGRLILMIAAALTLSAPARACDLALALAVDVSGSVDEREYSIQMEGLARALRDDLVSEALVRSQAALMVVQWTGSSRQVVSVDWTRVDDFDDLEALATRVAQVNRKWRNFSTAIGEALEFTAAQFARAPLCAKRTIDVSGDGVSNEGIEPREAQAAPSLRGITVNALVIEGPGTDLTGYFYENVILGPGAFVMTADGFDDYAEKIRHKLIRETTKQLADLR